MKVISSAILENYKDDEYIKRIDEIANNTLDEVDLQKLILDAENFNIKVEPMEIDSID